MIDLLFKILLFAQQSRRSQIVIMMSPPVSFPAGLRSAKSFGAVMQSSGLSQLICEPLNIARVKVVMARIRKILEGSGRRVLYKQRIERML